jgi:tRNA (adenine22-N1)-methyltransferase
VQERIVPAAIAVDVSPGPLEIAQKQVRALLLADKISVRLGDGLKEISPGEVQTVVIAGMGGATIKKILTQSPCVVAKLQRLILQPNVAAEMVRTWALHNNWKIIDEEIVFEDERFYEIIVLEPGKMEIKDEIYLFLGPKLVEKFHPLLVDLLRKQKAGDHEILNELKKSTGQGAKDKARTIEQKWQRIEQVIKCRLNAEI